MLGVSPNGSFGAVSHAGTAMSLEEGRRTVNGITGSLFTALGCCVTVLLITSNRDSSGFEKHSPSQTTRGAAAFVARSLD